MKFKFIVFIGLLATIQAACSENPNTKPSPENILEKLIVKADSGDAEAAYHAGMFYNNGIGTEQNSKEALKWFIKSTNGGDPLGAYKLGCYYSGQFGNVIEYNSENALKYKLISAEAGYSLAQHDVALYYLQSHQYDLAIKYLKKSAEQGYQGVYNTLATLYFRGDLINQDIEKARNYTKLSIANMNFDTAAKFIPIIKSMEEQMTVEQIKQSDAFVAEWKTAPTSVTELANLGQQRSIILAGIVSLDK